MAINYIFWDSDNTLVNTAEHHWNKHAVVLERHGIALDQKWRERIYTNNGGQNWDWLHAELGLAVEKQAYLDEIDSWYHLHIDRIVLRSGIAEALSIAKEKNLPMAVVSNGRQRSVLPALKAKNLLPFFKFVLCVEDYEGRKPQPAPYLAAKTRMQQIEGAAIDPAACLVIEDDPKGVEAGEAAGMPVLHRPPGEDNPALFLARFEEMLKG